MPNEKDRKSIRVVMPSVASFNVDYEDEKDLKTKICEKLDIEEDFTNLIFVERDEELLPLDVDVLMRTATAPDRDPPSTNRLRSGSILIPVVRHGACSCPPRGCAAHSGRTTATVSAPVLPAP